MGFSTSPRGIEPNMHLKKDPVKTKALFRRGYLGFWRRAQRAQGSAAYHG